MSRRLSTELGMRPERSSCERRRASPEPSNLSLLSRGPSPERRARDPPPIDSSTTVLRRASPEPGRASLLSRALLLSRGPSPERTAQDPPPIDSSTAVPLEPNSLPAAGAQQSSVGDFIYYHDASGRAAPSMGLEDGAAVESPSQVAAVGLWKRPTVPVTEAESVEVGETGLSWNASPEQRGSGRRSSRGKWTPRRRRNGLTLRAFQPALELFL